MDHVTGFLYSLYTTLQWPIIQTPETKITIGSLVYLLVLVSVLLWLARRLQLWLVDGPLLRTRFDAGARQAAGTLVRYLVLALQLADVVGDELAEWNKTLRRTASLEQTAGQSRDPAAALAYLLAAAKVIQVDDFR